MSSHNFKRMPCHQCFGAGQGGIEQAACQTCGGSGIDPIQLPTPGMFQSLETLGLAVLGTLTLFIILVTLL